MLSKRTVYRLWLAFGIALFAYGIATGGGIAGWMLSWELETIGGVFAETHVFLAICLIVVPLVLLARDADRRRIHRIDVAASAQTWGRRFLAIGLLAAAGGALCDWRTTLLPSPDDRPRRVVLDEISNRAPVPESKAILLGTPRKAYQVHYHEILTGRFRGGVTWDHNLVPMTGAAWTPAQPVRFLIDTRGNPSSLVLSASENGFQTVPGLLLRDELPVYVRRALEKKGLRVADDAMVLSEDRDFGRTPWLVCTAFCAIGAFFFLLLAWVWPWALSHTESEREALRPRVARYLAYTLGGLLILFSLVLAGEKLARVHAAARADGVITSVLEHHHSVGRYSYFVKYQTPDGDFEKVCTTGTPFSKAEGDHVVVLYRPDAPNRPEILAFDEDWVVVLIFLAPGSVIVMLGAILFRRKASSPRLVGTTPPSRYR